MPYIKKENRESIYYCNDDGLCIFLANINCAGDLNFAITTMIKDYIERKGECYQTYNDIMGALEGAKLELYRRKIAPYEDKKIDENGDVD